MATSDNVPHRYTGYDEKGKSITAVNATNANIKINPENIKAAVDKAKTNIDAAKKGLKKAIEDFDTNARDAITIEGVSGYDGIDELKAAVENVPSDLYETFDETVSKAQTEHDNLQAQYNQEAYDKVIGFKGVVDYKES